ncbi:methionine adenosyltransferase [Oribacterium sp. C9]|uniref:methionine adenosyltransferase n=1 Tax=Oribacterium sp. C9 TaxID=1943579 RepID=UPI00098FB9D1|nr:methionine adenosyltransferase [Oribacterium sp. C9]OON87941.1 methionine adenosyltransferase [Oribacterium sp. C9]
MLFSSEQVSNGHPDKICDQISDAIVTDILQHDKAGRIAAETTIKDYEITILGEVTTNYDPDYETLTRDVLKKIGLTDVDKYNIRLLISKQSPDIAMGVDNDGAGDQGMMFGYATNETEELLPIPYVLSNRALLKLREFNIKDGFKQLRPDAKAQVSFDYDTHRIDTFLISTQHAEETSLDKVREIVSAIMKETAEELSLNTDFRVLVNPTGRFVMGSSFADSGLTGRKIIADTYGGAAHHGGGAFSGKDPSKVDRSAAYMARKIARDIVKAGKADRCEVQLAYAIGVAEPVSVYVDCFGTEKEDRNKIWDEIKHDYDLTPKGIISSLKLRDVDYNLVSSYGHFGKSELPWEQ